MNASDLPQHSVRVGAVRIDWGTLHLVREGTSVRITPKAAAVLHLLLAQRGTTVSRRHIFDVVWPGSASADEVLTQVVNELRRAFMDSAKEAHFIATIPKLGYRWTGPEPEPVMAHVAKAAEAGPVEAHSSHAALNQLAPRRSGWPVLIAAASTAAIAVAGVLHYWPHIHSPQPAATATIAFTSPVRPLTAEPGRDLDPAVSKDGQRLAYVHVQAGKTELRLRQIGTAAYASVPMTADGTPASPAWSPDGKELIIVWRQESRCEIRRIRTDGSDLHTLDDHCPASIPSSVDWSADGRFVVFSRSDNAANALGRRDVAIYRAAPDGSNLKRLSHSQRWLSVDLHPRISADSRDVAFVRDADARHRVVSLPADGSSAEHETPVELWPYRVAWGPTPGTLLVSGHGRAPAEIQQVDRLSGAATMLVAESAGPGMALTPGTDRLIFERRSIDDNIWSVPANDLSAAAQRVTDETRSQLCPRISPDGKQLAYLSDEGGAMEVVLRSLASGAHAQLSAFSPDVPVDLAWSPHGGFIAVILGTPQGRRFAVLSAEGKRMDVPPSLRILDVTLVDWSHDETWLYVVVAARGRHELRRLHFPDFATDELVVDQSVAAL